jgi:hypothetical protein
MRPVNSLQAYALVATQEAIVQYLQSIVCYLRGNYQHRGVKLPFLATLVLNF